MRHALILVLCVSIAPVAHGRAAQGHPDFTGTWRIDVEHSTDVNADSRDTWIVTQTAETLSLSDATFPADHRVYQLDGSPTTIVNVITGEWTYRATWDGNRLVIRSEGENPLANSTEIWFMRGNQLVIEWHRRSATGRVIIQSNFYNRIR